MMIVRTMNDFYTKVDVAQLNEAKKSELLSLYIEAMHNIGIVLDNDNTDLLKLMNISRAQNKLYLDVLRSFEES